MDFSLMNGFRRNYIKVLLLQSWMRAFLEIAGHFSVTAVQAEIVHQRAK